MLLFSTFLRSPEVLLDYSFIIEDTKIFRDVKMTTISKYISEINNKIKEITNDYEFVNIKREGYIFRKKEMNINE